MATSKISNLNTIAPLNSNTANVYFVATDKQSGVSGKVSGTTLANGLYAYNTLNVGNTEVIFPNVVSQFAKNGESYIQVNLLNTADGGSADYVATANTGTDTTYFIDMGYANKDFVPGSEYNSLGNSIQALDGYLYVQGNSSSNVGGNLVIGTTTSNTHLGLIVGGGTTSNVIAQLHHNRIVLNRTVNFGDGTTQNTSADSARTYANGAFVQANAAFLQANGGFVQANAAFLTANTPTHVANSAALYANGAFIQSNAAFTVANNNTGINATQNTNIGLAWTTANNALANTDGVKTAGSLTVTGPFYAANTIRTPNVYPGSQTAINLSFTNSSLEKVNTASGLTITLANFVTGKFLDLFITNTDNSQHVITHGCSAINSSVGATTFNLGAAHTAYLRYACLGGDLANTYVAIVYQ